MYYGAIFHCFPLYCRFMKRPKNGKLTYTEKQRIVAGLAEGQTLWDLAKEHGRNKKTMVSYVETTPNKDKGTRSVIFPSDIQKKTQAGQ